MDAEFLLGKLPVFLNCSFADGSAAPVFHGATDVAVGTRVLRVNYGREFMGRAPRHGGSGKSHPSCSPPGIDGLRRQPLPRNGDRNLKYS